MDPDVDVIVIGGGGGGLVAAISAAESGKHILLIEKTSEVGGHTLNTQGMFPASRTRFQREHGIVDTPEDMTRDILEENRDAVPRQTVLNLARNSGKVAEWMADYCDVPLDVVTDFKYHGYSNYRIHAPPTRSGREVINVLLARARKLSNLDIATGRGVSRIILDKNGRATGVELSGSGETVTTNAVIIATGGYGANREMVEKYIPDAAKMLYFGSSDHRGEAVIWSGDLDAEVDYLDSYQAHSSVSSVGTLITWETVMKGAIIVNSSGLRFANEITGYSKFAKNIVRQQDSTAFEIYGADIHREMMERYEEYRETDRLGGIRKFDSLLPAGRFIGCDPVTLEETLGKANSLRSTAGEDEFGRNYFVDIEPPYYIAKITPALFHTQGGLRVNEEARIMLKNGTPSENVYAVGDAAAGITGHGPDGYVSGTGLLCAFVYGYLAGKSSVAMEKL